jgi:hypothetical protein
MAKAKRPAHEIKAPAAKVNTKRPSQRVSIHFSANLALILNDELKSGFPDQSKKFPVRSIQFPAQLEKIPCSDA